MMRNATALAGYFDELSRWESSFFRELISELKRSLL